METTLKGDIKDDTEQATRNSVEYGVDGIIRIIETGYQSRQTILALCEAATKLIEQLHKNNNNAYVLVDICGITGYSKEVHDERGAFLRLECEAMAVFGASSMTRAVGNWMIKHYNQGHPVKYFASQEKALAWLSQMYS